MKRNILNITLLGILIIFSTAIAFADFIPSEFDSKIPLLQGENEILIPEYVSPFYVHDLIKSYPEILTVTYFEFEEEKGYANLFGGVGENFIIYPNQLYNITVSKDMEVNLK